MVVAGKIFRLTESISIEDIAAKLSGFHLEEPYEEGDYKFDIIHEVKDLAPESDILKGVFSDDYIVHVFHRGTKVPLPRTVEAIFSFAYESNVVYLTVVERKRTANLIANKLLPRRLKHFTTETQKIQRSLSLTMSIYLMWTN